MSLSSIFGSLSSIFKGTPTPAELTPPIQPVQPTLLPEVSVLSPILITTAMLSKMAPNLAASKVPVFSSALNIAMQKFLITDPVVMSMFMAQVLHESGEFRWMEELASGAAYEGRTDLGNTHPGDGVRYKGRGPIGITGLANYTKVTIALGHNFITNPKDLSDPNWGCLGAAWFWTSHNLNQVAKPGTLAAFISTTRIINGGTNGEADREKYWKVAKKCFGVVDA